MTRWLRPPTTQSLTQAMFDDRLREAAARWSSSAGPFWLEIERYPGGDAAHRAFTRYVDAHVGAAGAAATAPTPPVTDGPPAAPPHLLA